MRIIGIFFIGILATSCVTPKVARHTGKHTYTLADYDDSEAIPLPKKTQQGRHHFPQWDINIDTAAGKVAIRSDIYTLQVRLYYEAGAGETLYEFVEYMCPLHLRISKDKSVLFLLVSGERVKIYGSWKETWIFAYDLRAQRMIGRIVQHF